MDDLERSCLEPTEYCDSDSPEIRELVAELTDGLTEPRAIRLALFHRARDGILSGMETFRLNASQVLDHGVAGCAGKALACVALHRAAGIPARFAVSSLDREFLGVMLKGKLTRHAFQRIPALLPHVMPVIRTESGWVRAETSMDIQIHQAVYQELFDWSLDWDGESDVCPLLEFCRSEFTYHDNLDEQLQERFRLLVPPLYIENLLFGIGNAYVHLLRRKARRRPGRAVQDEG